MANLADKAMDSDANSDAKFLPFSRQAVAEPLFKGTGIFALRRRLAEKVLLRKTKDTSILQLFQITENLLCEEIYVETHNARQVMQDILNI